jgi:DNA invertase Pin-like site-specific DNA recombinase
METAGIYVRVSTGAQRDNYSPESQIALGSEYAAAKSYAISPEHIYREVFTGKESGDHRPELQRLKAAIIAGEISVVIALKADRMFRDILDGMVFAQFLRSHKARLEFIQGNNDTSPLGQVMYALELFSAESHWEAIKEATERGRKARIASGKPLAGKKPLYGYRWEDEATKERLAIHKPEAEIVRRIYRHLAGGGSLASMVKRLRSEGVPSPAKGEWGAPGLSRLVRNEAYKGIAYARRWETFKNAYGKRDSRLRPKADWIPLPEGTIPAIIEPELWGKANAQIERNRATEGPRNLANPEAFLLRNGYAVCGKCGQPMAAKNRAGRPPFYACARNLKAGEVRPCTGTQIEAATLDQAIWEKIRLILGDPEWVKGYLSEQADTAVIDADLAAVEAELTAIGKRQAGLVRNLGLVDEDADYLIRKELADLKVHKERLQAEYRSIQGRRANLKRAEDFVDRLIARAATIDAMTYGEKRAILNEFGVKATVYPVGSESRFAIDMAFDLEAWETEASDSVFALPTG